MIWVLIAALLGISFLFSGLEAALLNLTAARLRDEAEKGSPAASRIQRLLDRRVQALSTATLMGHTCNVFAFGLLILHLAEHFETWGYLLGFLVALPVHVLWVELLPKSLVRHFPYRFLVRFGWILHWTQGLLRPLTWLGRELFGDFSTRQGSSAAALDHGRDAFRELTASIQREGTLTEDEAIMIQQTLDFESVEAGDLMMPLRRVTAVPLDMAPETVIQLARDTDIDQFPVMSTSGDLVGLIRVFELLRSDLEGKRLSDFIRRLLRIDEHERAIVVLQKLRRSRVELAMVKSASGRPLGIVSSHDIVQTLMTPPGRR